MLSISDYTEEVKEYIQNNLDQDTAKLALKKFKPGFAKFFALEQIKSRQKLKIKLPDWYSSIELIIPSTLSAEQSSSQLAADFKSSLVKGQVAIDLTGGLGIDSIALASKFSKVDYVESNEEVAEAAGYNFSQLGKNNITVHSSNAESFIKESGKVDLIYLDPSRRDQTGKKTFDLSAYTPDLVQLWPDLLKLTGHIMVKLSPMQDVQAVLREFPQINLVHIVSVDNECKELLFEAKENVVEASLHIHELGKRSFSFSMPLNEMDSRFLFNSPKKYVYDPSVGFHKSRRLDVLIEQFELSRISKDTMLLTSDQLHKEFPGRVFESIEISKPDKANIKFEKANVLTRNYPEPARDLQNRLGLKDGGENYVIGTTLDTGEKRIILARRII